MQKMQRQEPALEETRNSKVNGFLFFYFVFLLTQLLFYLLTKAQDALFPEKASSIRVYEDFLGATLLYQNLARTNIITHAGYAAITNTHLTETQVLHGGKASVLDNGILDFSPFSLQKCEYKTRFWAFFACSVILFCFAFGNLHQANTRLVKL
jgi:hypothetical protein